MQQSADERLAGLAATSGVGSRLVQGILDVIRGGGDHPRSASSSSPSASSYQNGVENGGNMHKILSFTPQVSLTEALPSIRSSISAPDIMIQAIPSSIANLNKEIKWREALWRNLVQAFSLSLCASAVCVSDSDTDHIASRRARRSGETGTCTTSKRTLPR